MLSVDGSLVDDLAPVLDLDVDAAVEQGFETAGDDVVDDLELVARAAAGADRRLTNYRPGGRLTAEATASPSELVVELDPPGAWALATSATAAHVIGRRGGVYRLARAAGGPSGSTVYRSGPLRHPGTQPWASTRRVVDSIADVAAEAVTDELERELNG